MPSPPTAERAASGRSGRPRDPALDAAILAATRELLAEHGYQGVTMQAVARRAGVFVPAIYRRWSSKSELVEAAVYPHDWEPIATTGHLRGDLRAYLVELLRTHDDPATRAVVPGIISEMHDSPAAASRLARRAAAYEAALDAIIVSAIARGELNPATTRRDALLGALMLGAALSIAVLQALPIDDSLADELTDFLLRGLQAC